MKAIRVGCQCIIPVEVVDGVAPVVLNVPTETRETHPNVQPRDLYIIAIHSVTGQHPSL